MFTYLDHAATTPVCEAAKRVIIEHIEDFGNPSSSYDIGHKMKILVEEAREKVANAINANPKEIYFTAGGSEADTWALKNRFSACSSMEHHAIKASTSNIRPNKYGIISVNSVNESLKEVWECYFPSLEIVSVMSVNNEIGTIQPIKEIAEIVHNNEILMHTDAVQAVGHIPIDVKQMGIDMLSGSGHKFGGIKGCGFLYIKEGTDITPLIYGGKQERGIRGSTENTLGIIAMGAAIEDAVNHMSEYNEQAELYRSKLMNYLLQDPNILINGDMDSRVYSNLNVQIPGVDAQQLVLMCNTYGICISAGSACNEGDKTPSHVLKAIGLTDEQALNSIRITTGHDNTKEEIDYACEMIPKIIARLRDVT